MTSVSSANLAPSDAFDLATRATRAAGDSILCALLCLYLATLLFEGPLRYGLVISGAPNALYARDLIPLGSLIFLFFRALLFERRVDSLIAVPAAVLIAHAALAVFLGLKTFQILFALKIFMCMVYGMAMWPLIRARFDVALFGASLIWLITLCGVGLNFILGRMPWEGVEYESAFGVLATTREWWVGSASRLPGFTRASFNAATILGITALLTMIRIENVAYRAAVAAVTLAAIIATTSKGIIIAFVFAAAWLVAASSPRHASVGRGLLYAVCAMTILLPYIVVLFGLGAGMAPDNLPALLGSAWERFARVWPEAVRLMPDGIAAVLGTGLGGIGTPQLYGHEPQHSNPGDNLAVFLGVNFGLLGVAYYLLPVMACRRVAEREARSISRAHTAVLMVTYGYGMSLNVIEDAFFGICLGICLALSLLSLTTSPNGART